MTTWRLLYENRFPPNAQTGTTILDFPRAAEGTQSVQSGPVFILFTGFQGLGIGEGRSLTYRPDDLLADVIGVDVSMEVAIILLFQGRPLTLFSTESGVSATLAATAPPTAGGNVVCRLTVRVGDASTTIDGLRFRQRFGIQALERRRLQVRWTTNGQLHVFLDGLLVAYENAVKPGSRFVLRRLSIGDIDLPTNGVVNAVITNFRVVELRENNSSDSLGELLQPECVTEIPERCQKTAQNTLEQLLRGARALMASFNASRTSPWRQTEAGSPFTPPALAAHNAATKAGAAFARYLRDGTVDARKDVVSNLKTLLEILAADQPAQFKTLVAKSDEARTSLDSYCKDVEYRVRADNPRLFQKLDPLNAELDELIHILGGS